MKTKYNKFAFDFDGTLVDANLQPKDGVVDMFYDILTKVENPKILICTGSGLKEVAIFLNKLFAKLEEKQLNEDEAEFLAFEKPNIDIACFGGAFIIKNNGKGEIVWNKKISVEQYNQVRQIINSFDKSSLIILQTMEGLFYNEPKKVKNKIKVAVLKSIKSLIGYSGINVTSLNSEQYNKKVKDSEVYSLNIITSEIEDNGKLMQKMQEANVGADLSINTSIQIRNGSKLNAIKRAFNIENGEGLVYVGDGLNDILAMKFASLSLAVGNNVKVLTTANYALESIADASDIMFTEADYSKISCKVIQNAINKNKWAKKQTNLDDNLDIMEGNLLI